MLRITPFNKKGEVSIGFMITLVIGIVTLFVVLSLPKILNEYIHKTSDKTTLTFSDCDLDGVENFLDRCPCLSTQGDGEKSSNLIGCPKGKTIASAAEDRRTCTTYKTEEDKYTETCDEKKQKCVTRCQETQSTSVAVEDKKPGIQTKGDLALALVDFAGKSETELNGKYTAPSYSESYGTSYPVLEIPLDFRVLNIGSGDIVNEFIVKAEICDKFGNNCDEKYSYPISSLGSNGEEALSFSITIGTDGDSCDSGGTNHARECKVKITADAGSILAETDERNNEWTIVVRIEGQDLGSSYEEQFKAFQIAILNDDGEGGKKAAFSGQSGGTIDLYCPQDNGEISSCSPYLFKYIDDDLGYAGLTAELFPSTKPGDGSCFIFAVEQGVTDSDNGAGIFAPGYIIYSIVGRNEALQPSTFFSGTPTNVQAAIKQVWDAKSDGSLLCKDGSWRQCGTGQSGVVYVGEKKRVVCEDQIWKPED